MYYGPGIELTVTLVGQRMGLCLLLKVPKCVYLDSRTSCHTETEVAGPACYFHLVSVPAPGQPVLALAH